jgi:hypothetical protein
MSFRIGQMGVANERPIWWGSWMFIVVRLFQVMRIDPAINVDEAQKTSLCETRVQ